MSKGSFFFSLMITHSASINPAGAKQMMDEFSTINSFMLNLLTSEIGYFIIHQRPVPPDDEGAFPG